MIQRLRQITKGLYRGSAPSPEDVKWLKEHLGIRKIISLDEHHGHMINRVCKLLDINHIMIPLDQTRQSLFPLLRHNLKDLLISGGPTFIHCSAGKDRTGFVSALFECKYMGKDPAKAIKEAEEIGFGKDIPPDYEKMIELYKKIIMHCKPSKDENNADIVSQEREYISDNRDSFLDESRPGSFSPYLSKTRQNPADAVYNYINDQSPTRENYHPHKSIKEHDQEDDAIPQVGTFDNDAGARGFGPTENYGGFFYD